MGLFSAARNRDGADRLHPFPPQGHALSRRFRVRQSRRPGAANPRTDAYLAKPERDFPADQTHPFCRYDYAVRSGWPLKRYGIEQQAEIVRHTFVLRRGGFIRGAMPLATLEGICRSSVIYRRLSERVGRDWWLAAVPEPCPLKLQPRIPVGWRARPSGPPSATRRNPKLPQLFMAAGRVFVAKLDATTIANLEATAAVLILRGIAKSRKSTDWTGKSDAHGSTYHHERNVCKWANAELPVLQSADRAILAGLFELIGNWMALCRKYAETTRTPPTPCRRDGVYP